MSRLSLSTLDRIPAAIDRPDYDIGGVSIGIVHFGPGAFFRAHQAAYFDRLLAQDSRWGICAVSMHSPKVRDALTPQDGLYTLAVLDAASHYRVIGSIRELLVAPESHKDVIARLASPEIRLVTLTVTEKGYGLDGAGSLDLQDAAVRHDLDHPGDAPHSVIGWLAAGLKARMAAGTAPFVTLSCDNLSDNGRKLGSAVVTFARASGDSPLADWVEREARFPCTMVDSITPASDDPLRRRVAASLGLEDAWPIQCESFTQWVIEDALRDALGDDAPDLAAVGAILTPDVALFERAKLRLLNGAHSSLAYIGLLLGLDTVAAAMATPALAGFVARLMREDIAPALQAGAGLDVAAYIDDVLKRFQNPALRHELSQIAWDGSKKLPFRLLATIGDRLADGGAIDRLSIPIAAWMLFVRNRVAANGPLIDPLVSMLTKCVSGPIETDVDLFLGLTDVFPPALGQSVAFRNAVSAAHAALRADPVGALR